jgi:ATP-independent RNA helicase DbpA
MLEMGFQEKLDAIVDRVPDPHQTLLFSANFPKQIQKISQRIMQQPIMVKVNERHDNETIAQHFYKISSESERLLALRLLLLHFKVESAVVFCNTKIATEKVADTLADNGFDVLALNGNLEQRDREKTLAQFANRSISVLAATDVAARGLDIDAIELVINFDIAHDPEIHLHRIGRTGRAGNTGIACSLYSDAEAHKLALLEGDIDPIVDTQPLPDLNVLDTRPMQATMTTLLIDGGKKQKLRPGDILGALTSKNGITGKEVGKIQISDQWAYVAVKRNVVKTALNKLNKGKLKGRTFRARLVHNEAHNSSVSSGASLYGRH